MKKHLQQGDSFEISLAKDTYKYKFLRHLRFLLTIAAIALTKLIYAQPVANFFGNPISGCAPLVVQFTDQSTGSPTSWSWNLGNATSSNLQNPAATYFTPGTYTVSLTVSNAQGSNSITKVQYITVYDTPSVNINAVVRAGCKPLTVDFTDLSVSNGGTIVSWQWDFGDGNISNQQNPSHTYVSGGSFSVSLRVTTSNGCSKTRVFPAYINVDNGVVANFSNSTPTTCSPPIAVSFQDLSLGQGPFTYQWDFGDGGSSTLPNPVHNYNSAGSYNVTLIISTPNGCKDTLERIGAVNIGNVAASFTAPLTACAGTQVSFTNTSVPAPAATMWSFGNSITSTQFSPTTTFNTPGTYTVTLTSTTGNCVATSSQQITILPRPEITFTANDSTTCNPPLLVNFQTPSLGSSYSWSFGDGGTSTLQNPSHSYNGYGNFSVTLTVIGSNGCSNTLTKTDYIKVQQLTASLPGLPAMGCQSHTQTFSVTNNLNLPIATYQWNFGSAGSSSLPNPTATFGPGVHNVSVTITTTDGCTATASSTISVGVPVHANFSGNPLTTCAITPIEFSDLSTGPPSQWFWDFGDGGTSTQQNPTYQYSDTGHFTVTLVVVNFGCRDTISFINYVHILPPIASIQPQFNCAAPYTFTFTDASVGADTWLWDFGDGNTSTLQNPPPHTYSSPGTYTVSLSVHNNASGCDNDASYTALVVDENPDYTASLQQSCRLSPVTFTMTNTNTANITNVSWNFGDGGTGSGASVQHTYSTPGTYTVTMYATDTKGCIDTIVKSGLITIYGPTANFSAPGTLTCSNLEITFNDLSQSDGIHPIVQWSWDFGDGNVQQFTAPPFNHTYSAVGAYNVRLKVIDNIGCTDSINLPQLLQIGQVNAGFTVNDTLSCPNRTLNFLNQSSGQQLQFSWDFDDGSTSLLPNPLHSFANNGIYNVSLVVTGQYGCKDTIVQPITVLTPLSRFQMSDSVSVCPPMIVHFTSAATGYESLVWDFGDGASSILENPDHTYTYPGQYIVKLTALGHGGTCSSVYQDTINISGPQGVFTYAPLVGCKPLVVSFTASTQNAVSVIWDFLDGTVASTQSFTNTHTYSEYGTYIPRIILRDPNGCEVPIRGLDTIRVFGVQTDFVSVPVVMCDSGNVQFSSTQSTNDVITNHQWDFGDSSPSVNQQNPIHFYQSPGLYNTALITTTQHGCKDTANYPVPIRVVRSPQLVPLPPISGCIPFSGLFAGALSIPDTSAIQWSWNFGNGQTSATQSPGVINYNNTGVYNVVLSAVNSTGCISTVNTTVSVHALPTIVASYDTTICQGRLFTLKASGGAAYAWSGPSMSCTVCASPVITPMHTSTYYLTGTDIHGCVNRDTISIKVVEPFALRRSPNDTLCVGESVTISATGTDSYTWVAQPGGNTYNTATVTVRPQQTTTYVLTATDYKNCFTVIDSVKVKVYPIPVVNAGKDTTINVGQSIRLTPTLSSDVSNVRWTPTGTIVAQNNNSITVAPKQTTTYTLVARNDGGCKAVDDVTVYLICNGENFFVPNTFTPNNDGMNDVFYPRGSGLFRIKSMRIFDRWGEMVFSKTDFRVNDPNSGWDGTYKGTQLNMDVFIYMIEIVCDNGQILLHKGNVALIK